MSVDTPRDEGTAVSWLEIFPLSSAILSGVMALNMANRLRQKEGSHEAAWNVAFSCVYDKSLGHYP